MGLDFLVCILLECERTKTKILHFYIGTKCIPFKKGPKLCASDFGDVQKNMIYLVWRCPTFEGPIFMLEQERWQRWLKKPEQILQILLLFGIVLAGSQLMTIVAPFSHEGAKKVKKNEGKWQFPRHCYFVWCAMLVAQPQLMPMMVQSA